MKSNLRFALAVNEQRVLAPKHFGDADNFLLYEHGTEGMSRYRELRNPSKSLGHSMKHGSEEKAKLLIDLLRDENVEVLISKKFGRNLSRVN